MKQIRLVCTADTHLGFDYPLRPKVSKIRRGDDFFRNFECVLQYALDNSIEHVIHGGDLFFRSKAPAAIVDKVYMLLHKYLDQGLTVILVPGNHERSVLPASLLSAHPNFYVFEKPRTFSFQIQGLQLAATGFPNIRHNVRTQFPGVLAETDWQQPADIRLLIMHQAVEGATVGAHNFTFRHQPDVIRMRDIPPSFHAALCGHIHRRQTLMRSGAGSVPVIYPGSIERTSFAEKDEVKGFLDITISYDQTHQSIRIAEEFIQLPSRQMYEIILPESTSEKTIIPCIESLLANLPEHSIVRIRPRSESHNVYATLLSTDRLRKLAKPDMIIQLYAAFFRS